ncbi:hypothetical protein TIFTF001_002621 [Ficus carica]|uniref:Uncharacterized protein n=1 Tax=Ficus carica TaxID=3494 RepID=A0AA87Z5R4_FICCA|nr:hypothetical protein TIFTF001_002621 [Ficus carica]
MATDSELIERLREFLRSLDLTTTTTTAIVRRKLEEDFGVGLSEKKAFIREQVDLFLQSENEEENDRAAEAEPEEIDGSGSGQEDDGEEVEESSNRKIKSQRSFSNKEKRKPGGFTKQCSLSPQHQEFIGVPEMARTEDPSNRRNVICDEPLRALFNVDSIGIFQMSKALLKHIWSLDSDTVVPAKSREKEYQPRHEREDALVNFRGTGESVLSRAEVIKRMQDYIKQNYLQDPSDKRRTICDEKLKQLFSIDSFTGFTISKLLAAHFTMAD